MHQYNIEPLSSPINQDCHQEYFVSPHWAGVCGIEEGTAYGDQPQEAQHSDWQAQLEVLGGQANCMDVLPAMQKLYSTRWERAYEWNSKEPLTTQPPDVDPAHHNGAALKAAGRSPAVLLYEASETKTIHFVYDWSQHTQMVAVAQTTEITCDANLTSAGIQMIFSSGAELENLFLTHKLLEDFTDAGGTKRRCTQIGPTNRIFKDYCYVCVSKVSMPPFRSAANNPTGTCSSFARYGGCEHVEYVKMLQLRVRDATLSTDTLPMQRKRGRKPGPITARGKAMPKEPRQGRIKKKEKPGKDDKADKPTKPIKSDQADMPEDAEEPFK